MCFCGRLSSIYSHFVSVLTSSASRGKCLTTLLPNALLFSFFSPPVNCLVYTVTLCGTRVRQSLVPAYITVCMQSHSCLLHLDMMLIRAATEKQRTKHASKVVKKDKKILLKLEETVWMWAGRIKSFILDANASKIWDHKLCAFRRAFKSWVYCSPTLIHSLSFVPDLCIALSFASICISWKIRVSASPFYRKQMHHLSILLRHHRNIWAREIQPFVDQLLFKV